ncbi:MAG: YqhA family protein [Acidimicrobiia bacterium]
MGRWFERARYLLVPACVTIVGLAGVVFVWAFAKAVSFATKLPEKGAWKRDAVVGDLLGTLDLVLVGAVLVIVATGLWQLFVGDLRLPAALSIEDLTELKSRVGEMLVLVLVIQFAKVFLARREGVDLLYAGAAVALVGLTLVVFTRGKGDKPPGASVTRAPGAGDTDTGSGS